MLLLTARFYYIFLDKNTQAGNAAPSAQVNFCIKINLDVD